MVIELKFILKKGDYHGIFVKECMKELMIFLDQKYKK